MKCKCKYTTVTTFLLLHGYTEMACTINLRPRVILQSITELIILTFFGRVARMKDSFSFFYSSRNSKKFHFPSFPFLFAVQYAAIDRIVLTFPPQRSLLGVRTSLQKAVNAIVLFSVLTQTSSCARATKKGEVGNRKDGA